jgi:alpha-N-arabinofuranosidase
MKTGIALFASVALRLGCTVTIAAQQAAPAVPAQLTVTINAQQTAAPVSKYLFGMFIEHGGSLIYRSLWAEMIDDRKFFYAISSGQRVEPHNPADRGLRAGNRMAPRQWRLVGPDEAVVMDSVQPFVGEHSPRIALDPGTAHGIRQSGLTVVKGKLYTGRIYLRGTAGSNVKVVLIWGQGAGERQTISIAALTNEYTKYPLSFTAKANSDDATLEVTGTGSGNFHIGTVSLMPADNVQGFRPDTIALLRQLHSGMWRLPGGNFISGWSWYNSVGPIDKRPPVYDDAWGAMQSNDVGLDEFMTLCGLIGVEPYITVNAGLGDEHSAAQEVEYMNGAVSTLMRELRARNGHSEPYHVKFWDVGNEPYGDWQLGHVAEKYYEVKHNLFAQAMRKVDPSITILASGAMPDEMTVEGQPRVLHMGYVKVDFGSEFDWTGGLIKNCWGNFDGLTEHWYARAGKRFDYQHAMSLPADAPKEDGYVNVDRTLLEFARYPANRVSVKAEEWQKYEELFPAMIDKKIFLSIDEYSYSGAPVNLKLALAYGTVFNEMLRHTDFLKMSAFTMGVSTLNYSPTAAVFNTTGLLFKMYGDHIGPGSVPVEVSGNSPQPPPQYPVAADQPRVTSGSPTYPLDMVAALTADHKYLTIAVVNATESEQKFNLEVRGVRLAGPSTLWQLTGSGLDAENSVGQPPQVEVKEIPIRNAASTISIAPITLNIYRFPIEQ